MVAVCKSQEAAHKLDFHTLAAMADEAERRAKWEKAGGELNPDKFQNVCHKLVFWVICEVESHESKGFGKGLAVYWMPDEKWEHCRLSQSQSFKQPSSSLSPAVWRWSC